VYEIPEKLNKYHYIVIKYPQADTVEAAPVVVRKLDKEKVVEFVPEELELPENA
jgi:hypothetical protein